MNSITKLFISKGLPPNSNIDFGIFELVVDSFALGPLMEIAATCNLVLRTDFNARAACHTESAEEAASKFRRRIGAEIARPKRLPPSAHFRALCAFLEAYRDGNSNQPAMPER